MNLIFEKWHFRFSKKKLTYKQAMVADLVHCASMATMQPSYIVIAFSLATTRQSTKRRVVALSSCRPVSREARQTARCRAARCRNVVLSLGL
jgi:hypothetical protein